MSGTRRGTGRRALGSFLGAACLLAIVGCVGAGNDDPPAPDGSATESEERGALTKGDSTLVEFRFDLRVDGKTVAQPVLISPEPEPVQIEGTVDGDRHFTLNLGWSLDEQTVQFNGLLLREGTETPVELTVPLGEVGRVEVEDWGVDIQISPHLYEEAS